MHVTSFPSFVSSSRSTFRIQLAEELLVFRAGISDPRIAPRAELIAYIAISLG